MIRARAAAALLATLALSACGAPPEDQPSDAAATPAAAPAPDPVVSRRDIANDFTAVQVATETPGDAFVGIATDVCDGRDFCRVAIWTDAAAMARGFPMSDREVAAMAFQYSINRSTGFEQLMWDCDRYPQTEPDTCLN